MERMRHVREKQKPGARRVPSVSDRREAAQPAGPLTGIRVVTVAVNAPGPVAAARLCAMGAEVVKVEPPGGDPLESFCPSWYGPLAAGQEVVRLDLKRDTDTARLETMLSGADLFLTSSRPSALARLGLSPGETMRRHPGLSYVEILGEKSPNEERPGHDLTYQAALGLVAPPNMPATLLADLAGAERAASAALSLLLARERTGEPGHERVALAETAEDFAAPLRHGLTAPGGLLGGGDALYGLYQAREGWVAVAALEPHFRTRLCQELDVEEERAALAEVFAARTAEEWERWAAERDLPLAAVRQPG